MQITDNIILREWRDEDLVPFYELNSDEDVMEFFPFILSKEGSDDLAKRLIRHFDDHGFGMWVLEVEGKFAGFCGFLTIDPSFDFAKGVEIGWRMKKEFWGKGIMTKAAEAVLDYGFNTLHLKTIYSFTAKINTKSEKLMKRIGLEFQKEFTHPKISKDNPLSKHILYSKNSCQ